MIIYILIFSYLLFCVWNTDIRGKKRYARVNFYVLFAIFVLFAGLRYKIGGDTLNYMATWKNYPDLWNFRWADDIAHLRQQRSFMRYQTGWIFYVMLIKGIFGSYYALQLVSSLLLNWGVFRTVRRYSSYPFLTLLFYFMTFNFYQLEFEVARECVAVGLFLLISFDNWVRKRWVLYYVGAAIAFSIHLSAVVMFALPLMRYVRWNMKQYLLFFILPTLLLAVGGRIFLNDLLMQLTAAEEAMTVYQTRTLEDVYNNNYIVSALYTPVFVLGMMLLWRKEMPQRFMPIVYTVMALFIMALFDSDCGRFANFIIIPFYAALTPAVHYLVKRCRTVWIAVLLFLCYSVPQIYVVYSGGAMSWSRYFPYQTVIYPNQTAVQKKYWK